MSPLAQWTVAAASFVCGVLGVWAGLSWAGATVPSAAEVTGFSGNAGEWEMTATLTRSGDSRELSGPMKMTHVGWCSVSDPQAKYGILHVRLHPIFPSIDATVLVDGVSCTFEGSLTDAYEGKLRCPDRRPVSMLMWIRS